MMVDEKIYEIFWQGPFEWDHIESHCNENHVLYQICGHHPLYGRDVLLYIGSSTAGIKERLRQHDEWVADEYDDIKIRLGCIRNFESWKDGQDPNDYTKLPKKIVEHIEALLIYANQPAYNDRNKSSAERAKRIRVFNSEKSGHLLPEVSHKYYFD